MPAWWRALSAGLALAMIGFGLPLFVAPQAVLAMWPWTLTPLTARAVAAWLLGVGVSVGQGAWENDLERVRSVGIGLLTFAALQVVALARYPGAFAWGTLPGNAFLLGVSALAVLGGWVLLDGRRAAAARAALGTT